MSYLIYYLQFILPFVIHDLIYHLSSKMFLISLFYSRDYSYSSKNSYNSKKIFLSYCSIKLVKNIRYNRFQDVGEIYVRHNLYEGREDLYIGGGERI